MPAPLRGVASCLRQARAGHPMHRASDKRLANQPSAIRAKIRFWRAPMRREVSAHENFFIAKICDSESAQGAFGGVR
jgi:hypothetical protein